MSAQTVRHLELDIAFRVVLRTRRYRIVGKVIRYNRRDKVVNFYDVKVEYWRQGARLTSVRAEE